MQGENWFAYSDKEKNDIVATLEGKKYDIQRSKGLGENEPDMMWLTTMNPATRRLIKVMPEDVSAPLRSLTCCWAMTWRAGRERTSYDNGGYFVTFGTGGYFTRKESNGKKKTPSGGEKLITLGRHGHAEVLEQPITETLEINYMPYAMSVIVSRAIPEIDGFKPSTASSCTPCTR